MNSSVIHCIGDSHVSVFSGTDRMQPIWPELSVDRIPLFKTYRLGPVTAYNLSKLGSSTQGREKLFEVLRSLPSDSWVLFCFGEIDCRVHLLKQAMLQNRPLEEVVKECVERYWSVVQEVGQKGFKVIVLGVIASTIDENIDEPDYAAYGSCLERNEVTKIFNGYLKDFAIRDGIDFINIFFNLIKPSGLTDLNLYVDRIHLSQKAIPLVVNELKIKFPELNWQLFKSTKLNKLSWAKQNKIFNVVCYMHFLEHKLKLAIIKFKQIALKFVMRSKFLYELKLIIDWHRAGHSLPPPHIIKQCAIKKYQRKFGINVLIETGTFLGDMVAAMLPKFMRLYSIEVSQELATNAKQRFVDEEKVTIIQGDSGLVMRDLLKQINEPILFWLDGHYSAGITGRGELETPIYKELDAILNHQIKNHVILIDDARLFVGKDDYPTIKHLTEYVKKANPRMQIQVKDDIIRINE